MFDISLAKFGPVAYVAGFLMFLETTGPSAHNVLHYQLHATLSFRVYCAKFEMNTHFECLFRVYIISSLRDGPKFSEGVQILQ